MSAQSSTINAVGAKSKGMGKGVESRFPARANGAPVLGYATLSHSNLKSPAKVAAAQGHNTRTTPAPNVRADAHPPLELFDERSGPYLDRVKAILREHKVPVNFRKGGVIACEDIYGASPEYWNRNGSWKQKPITEVTDDPVIKAGLALARRKHGSRLVSCSLHVDEESPHLHVVSVPLMQREHAKRGRKPKNCPVGADGKKIDTRKKELKWSLDASSQRGQSRFLEKNHDDWAQACEPFGLIRGAKGSEMTAAERRARRNRQTGRASLAEMEARQERERLQKEIEEKEKEAEADRLAARDARRAAEAAQARADEQEAENSRVRAELDEREVKIAEREEKTKSEAEALDNQLRFVERALDPESGLKISMRDGFPHFEGLDVQERSAIRKIADRLGVFVKRIVDLVDREAAIGCRERVAAEKLAEAERRQQTTAKDRQRFDEDRAQKQGEVGILQKALEPNANLRFVMEGPRMTVVGFDDGENKTLNASPGWFKKAIVDIVRRLRSIDERVSSLDSRTSTVESREIDISKKESLLARREKELSATEAAARATTKRLEEQRQRIHELRMKAIAFRDAWHDVPEEERTPAVDRAIDTASQLSLDDIPPGFNFPGKGGHGR